MGRYSIILRYDCQIRADKMRELLIADLAQNTAQSIIVVERKTLFEPFGRRGAGPAKRVYINILKRKGRSLFDV